MNIKPLGNRVLIRKKKAEAKTASGLLLPESARKETNTGEVIATGKGLRNTKGERVPMEVKTGDKVIFAKHAGTTIDNEDMLIMPETDIVAIDDRA